MSAVAADVQSRWRFFSHNIVIGLIALAEASIVICAGLLIYAYYVAPENSYLFSNYLAALAIYATIMVQWFHTIGLYRLEKIVRPQRYWKKITTVCIGIFLLLVFCAFAFKISADFSRVWSVTWLVSNIILLVIFRFCVAAMVRRSAISGILSKNIIIYGADDNGQRLINYLNALNEPWNRIVAVFDDRLQRSPDQCAGYAVLGGIINLVDYARTHASDEILLALPSAGRRRIIEIVDQLSPLPANVRVVPDLKMLEILERPMSREYGVPMVNVLKKPISDWGVVGKRVIDFGIAGTAIIAGLPFLALIAAWIKLDSKGPVLFRQRRYGFQNQVIGVFKFRTMYVDQVDADAERLTTRDDPRVTRAGKWLRRLSLDEVPQLLNVLSGEMSLVGPRPHAIKAKAGGKLYADVLDTYAVRMKVKPGITGWAQVNGWRGNTETEDDLKGRVEYDLDYIENWSVGFDLYIILKTFVIVLKSENSY